MRRKLDMAIISTRNKVANFMESKSFGDSQVVVALVLIAVAIGLCIVFRENVNTIINSLSKTVQKTVTDLANGTVSPTTPIN